ncbi:MAG: DNA topoisomerase I [Candidatus Micrarchaeia archaeon]
MQLIICEKPKVAEKIAYALADGPVKRVAKNGISYFEIQRKGIDIAIASAVGHVYSLDEEKKTTGYPVFDIKWKPAYEVDKASGYTRAYVKNIEDLATGANEVISACDYDIEGSLIGYNAIRFAGGKKDGKRMKFSALTKDDLVDAYEQRARLDVENAQAGEARHMLDWYYGINLSRALMSAIRKKGIYKVMSIGRVQGPALSILVKKENQIAAFKSEPYWEIHGKCKEVEFSHSRDRFTKEEEAKRALAESKEDSTVASMEKKQFFQEPSPPFDLTSLQVEAYRQFRFDPSATLALAQTLYEGSLISYPRTSSQKLPLKLNHPRILQALSKNPAYEKLAKKLLDSNLLKPHEGKKEDPAHPAIHPTGQLGDIGEREKKLYDLIVKRYFSCFAPHAKREGQKVVLDSGTQKYQASGNRTVEPGWFEFYAPYLKLDEVTLPPFDKGEHVKLTGLKMDMKMTKPPKRYTPASIISDLEKLNLGTKATRSVVVDTLFKRGYLEGKGSITATPFGISVYNTLHKNVPEILDEDLTRNIEDEIEKIQTGAVKPEKVVKDGKDVLVKIIDEFKQNEAEVAMELAAGFRQKEHSESIIGACNKCADGMLRVIQTRAGKQFAGCTNYPKCTNMFPLPAGAKIQPLNEKCEKCGTPRVRVIRAGKKPFDMCLDFDCETKKGWGRNTKPVAGGTQAAKPATPMAKTPSQAVPAPAMKSSPTQQAKPAPATTGSTPVSKPVPAPSKPMSLDDTIKQMQLQSKLGEAAKAEKPAAKKKAARKPRAKKKAE